MISQHQLVCNITRSKCVDIDDTCVYFSYQMFEKNINRGIIKTRPDSSYTENTTKTQKKIETEKKMRLQCRNFDVVF